jgi:hypothetical protein
MTLEELRQKAFFQNTVDVWIMYCKFPLCIKESGGMYERGKDKAQFLDQLSKITSDDAAAYTLKLSGDAMTAIRSFSN